MARYPKLPELFRAPNPDRLLVVRRSLFSILSNFFWLCITCSIVATLVYFFGDLRITTEVPVLRSISFHWLLGIPILQFLEIVRKYHNDLYIFGKTKVTHLGGRLSLSYYVPTIQYEHIRALQVRQDIPGRLFNYGDIELGTASHDEVEMIIRGVRSPIELAWLVEDLIRFRRQIFIDEVYEEDIPDPQIEPAGLKQPA